MRNEKLLKYSVAFLLTAFSFILYVMTLYPDIGPRDSSEFALASYTLGVAHPSGYPLLVMLGKLFSYIPFGEIAFRINLVSALFSSATILMVFLIIFRITKSLAASMFGSLTLCLSFLYWQYSTHIEVFTVNSFFLAIMLYVLMLWSDAQGQMRRKYLYLFSFLLGLALSHHHILMLVVPALAYYVASNEVKILKEWKVLLLCSAIFVIGLSPFLYLPIRAAKDPFLNWGDPSRLQSFIDVVTRAEFGKGRLSVPYLQEFSFSSHINHLWLYARRMNDQFTAFGIIIGLMSLLLLFKKGDRRIGVTLLLLYFMTGPFFAIMIGQSVIDNNLIALAERFYISSFVVFAILIGIGGSAVQGLFTGQGKDIRVIIMVLLMALPIFLFGYNFKYCDMRNNHILSDLPMNVFLSLPRNSVFYTVNDSTRFGIWYMQGVRGIRQDVIAIWPFQPRWYIKQLAKRYPGIPNMPQNIDQQQIRQRSYYVDIMGGPFERLMENLFPQGLAYKIDTDKRSALSNARIGMNNMLNVYSYRGDYNVLAHKDLFTREVIIWYGQAANNIGAMLHNSGDYDDAITMYQRAMTMVPDDHVSYFNSGLIYRYKGDHMRAASFFKMTIEKNPKFLPAYKHLAVLYANNLGDTRSAVEYFEKYLSFMPDDSDVPVIKDYIKNNKGRM